MKLGSAVMEWDENERPIKVVCRLRQPNGLAVGFPPILDSDDQHNKATILDDGER